VVEPVAAAAGIVAVVVAVVVVVVAEYAEQHAADPPVAGLVGHRSTVVLVVAQTTGLTAVAVALPEPLT